mgnify:CR=1 FL=1
MSSFFIADVASGYNIFLKRIISTVSDILISDLQDMGIILTGTWYQTLLKFRKLLLLSLLERQEACETSSRHTLSFFCPYPQTPFPGKGLAIALRAPITGSSAHAKLKSIFMLR